MRKNSLFDFDRSTIHKLSAHADGEKAFCVLFYALIFLFPLAYRVAHSHTQIPFSIPDSDASNVAS